MTGDVQDGVLLCVDAKLGNCMGTRLVIYGEERTAGPKCNLLATNPGGITLPGL
jgi:hypothetical protein